jgi:hypothetical protein
MAEPCIQEQRISKLEAIFDYFVKRTTDHITEGEKQGGHRDRLTLAEQNIQQTKKEISTIKKGYWKVCIVSGILGGLIARATPDVLIPLFNFIMKVMSK